LRWTCNRHAKSGGCERGRSQPRPGDLYLLVSAGNTATGGAIQEFGKYQLIRRLASGGMAEVFLAKAAGPLGFEKTLVLKRILPHLVEDPEFVEMFLSEAKLAAQLNHHNIVQIFDFGVVEGAYFIAMEYIDGPNLRVLSNRLGELKASKPVPFPLCAKIVSLACEGLAYAHDLVNAGTGDPLNLVHRDISPDNIMLTRTGGVKVVDFGIAKATSQMHRTRTGIVKGKVMYMAPEQIHNKALDRRADVYSLGVVLYNLATASSPYEADSDISLMHAVLLEPPVKARERRHDLPEEIERIIEKAMRKEIDQRYQNCFELQDDLERYLRRCDAMVGSAQIAELVREATPPESAPPMRGVTVRQRATPVLFHVPAPDGMPRRTDPEAPAGPDADLTRPDAMLPARPAPRRNRRLALAATAATAVTVALAGSCLLLLRSPGPESAASPVISVVQTIPVAAAQERPVEGQQLPPATGEEPVQLVVVSDPLEAQVKVKWNGGQEEGTAPFSVALPRSTEAHLEVTRSGYLPYAAVVLADASKSYTAKLRAMNAAVTAPVPERRIRPGLGAGSHRKKSQETEKKSGKDAPVDVIDITADLEAK